jgi:DNA adenine methylase
MMRKRGQKYLEPFVGAAWIVSEMKATVRWASDTNPYLIAMYKALQKGWEPPREISEERYKELRQQTGKQKQDGPQVPLKESIANGYPLAEIGFAGHACSFAGIWYGSYARNPKVQGFNFAQKGANTLGKPFREKIQKVTFRCCSYDEWEPKDALIYCDPPYSTTNQPYFSKVFDSDKFWDTMRKWSENNIVVISEYSAPDDFPCIASIPTKTRIDCKSVRESRREEKIFSKTPYKDPFQGVF